jgi:pimeloyl-ACP methyl ester carboxylesterase
MVTQFISVDNCKIAYVEKNANAPQTIFFIPGNSVSKRIWRKQLDSVELSSYRMIAIDFPASGDSDVMEQRFYTFAALAEISSKVIAGLSDNKPYIIAGVSLGTNIIAEMLAFDVNPRGLILAGPCIFGEHYKVEQIVKPGTHVGIVFTDHPDDDDIVSYAHETSLSKHAEDVDNFLEDFKSVKAPFRSALSRAIYEGNFNDEVALIKEKNIPSLVIFGKDELIVNHDYLDTAELPLWNQTVYKIEGASHLVNIDQPIKFNKVVNEFAEFVFK